MDAIRTVGGRAAEPSVARSAPAEPLRGGSRGWAQDGAAAEDSLTLSREFRIRQDVARQAESSPHEEETPAGGRAREQAASAAERERVRDLILQDMQVRSSGAADGVERDVRSVPSFEVDIGPYGRAYAVGDGAFLKRPTSISTDASEAGAEAKAEAAEDVDAEDEVTAARLGVPEDDEEAAEDAEETDGVSPSETTGVGRRDAAPAARDDGEPSREVEARERESQPARRERTARAYQAAVGMTGAPGGFDASSVDAVV